MPIGEVVPRRAARVSRASPRSTRSSLSRERFRPDAVRGLLDGHLAGEDNSHRILALPMLEQWKAEVVDEPLAAAALSG